MSHILFALGAALAVMMPGGAARAADAEVEGFRFRSIDGGEIGFADWDGPVLVVNTASLCGSTPQLADLQALWERYGPEGLTVLAVPSDSFGQELADEKQVSEFCTLEYGITLPMTAIVPVRGDGADPFYAWLREATGFEPDWNFNKVLVSPAGDVLGTWRRGESPTGPAITGAIEAALGAS